MTAVLHIHTATHNRIKMVMLFPHFTYPLTPFFKVLAVHSETVDLTLEMLVKLSLAEHVGFPTHRAFRFAICLYSILTCTTHMMSTLSEEWLCEKIFADWTNVVTFWFIHKSKSYVRFYQVGDETVMGKGG